MIQLPRILRAVNSIHIIDGGERSLNIPAKILERARRNRRRIVFPESLDERILRAVAEAMSEDLCIPILIGDPAEIRERAEKIGIDLSGAQFVDLARFERFHEYVRRYVEMRGKSDRIARRILSKPVYFAAMMVKMGDADAVIAGASTITATVIMAGKLILGLQEGVSIPSSFFLMDVPGFDRLLFFADAAVNPDPNPEQLADIAIATGRSYEAILGQEPRIALLSFSTKGSASHPMVDKVVKAVEIAREKAPDLMIDGELQADAALIPEIAEKKVKGESPVAGKANVLIFPDLNSGNIGYKLVQHLARARAYGPILQGFRKPISDLSRGAKVEDIVGSIAILAAQQFDDH